MCFRSVFYFLIYLFSFVRAHFRIILHFRKYLLHLFLIKYSAFFVCVFVHFSSFFYPFISNLLDFLLFSVCMYLFPCIFMFICIEFFVMPQVKCRCWVQRGQKWSNTKLMWHKNTQNGWQLAEMAVCKTVTPNLSSLTLLFLFLFFCVCMRMGDWVLSICVSEWHAN